MSVTAHEHVGGEVAYKPEDFLPPAELPPEELEAIRLRMLEMDKLFATAQKAKYKIELFLGKARMNTRPTPGIMSFWESGSKLHGGGDAKIYFCPGKMRGKNECTAPIPDEANGSGYLFCVACGTRWEGADVIGEHQGNLPMKKWAEVILVYFRRLEHNCDIYLKYAPDDIRTHALQETGIKSSVGLYKARAARAKAIYPLSHIIKDTSGGADLLGRFHAFLVA